MGNNFMIPYSGYIPGGISVGTEVTISGRPHHDFNSFSINLSVGPNLDGEVVFHFNPRFNQGEVVRNHKQGGSWGMEDKSGGMPFRRGHNFEFNVKVEKQAYKISVNGRHFCVFHHRIPIERAQYLFITGDVTIMSIQYQGKNSYPVGNVVPPPYPGISSYPSHPGAVYPQAQLAPLYNPPVPLITPIQGGMYPGKIIYISGVPRQSNPSRFSINLICGAFDSADQALHFDVRFNFGSCRNVIVRNHRQAGSYGSEERHQNYFPFTPGVNFEVMILAEHNSFKIAVNNQHFTEFYYRIHPLQRVDYLNIVGDVSLSQVRFQ